MLDGLVWVLDGLVWVLDGFVWVLDVWLVEGLAVVVVPATVVLFGCGGELRQ